MNNPKAQKLIKKILDDLDHNGIIINTLVNDLKKLRPLAVEEKRPVVAKAIRLTFEHVEAYDSFYIPIPEDDPIELEEEDDEVENDSEDETEVEDNSKVEEDEDDDETIETEEKEAADFDSKESLMYLISLLKDADNRMNKEEIREYNEALQEYAEEN